MPRRRPAEVIPPTALVASVTRYSGKVARIYQPQQSWQAECYRQYSICGEARFAAKFFGNAVSRAVLGIERLGLHNKPEAQAVGPAVEALASLFGGEQNQSAMLSAIGMHLTIAGECYLVGRAVADHGDLWEVVPVTEVTVTGDQWTINYGNSVPLVTLTEDDVVLRIWIPSPVKQIEADSPFRSLLPILSEIEWLTRHIFAQITSRLAGAGILLMPQSMTFPPPPAQPGPNGVQEVVTTSDADSFMATLADAMMRPIEDPGSPSAVVPIVVTAPDDAIDRAKLLTFWSELDAESMSLRNEAIRRFALGMDLPPEQVLGMSSNSGTGGGTSNGISHWGAWQIEEATIKLHIEPMLDVICNALTLGYLRPQIDDGSYITYDTSALRLRPDRSKEAFELYDRGLISATALRRENGFAEDDRPNPAEFATWLLMRVASGSSTPEQVAAALKALGVALDTESPTGPVPGAVPRPTPPPPSLLDHPTRPRTPGESALVAACQGLVFRALERAGNRLRAQGSRPPGVPAYETHLYVQGDGRCLEDAWSCADKVLDGIADPREIVPLLDTYCRSLIAQRAPHDVDKMIDALAEPVLR